jgi:hypothetical protein
MSVSGGPDLIQDGLVLCLDAANTKSYPGSGTVWTDLSRNGCNATLVNGPIFNSTNGGAIGFDKTDDYAQIISNSPLFCTNGNWSCQVWCNPIDLGEGNFGRIFENVDQAGYSNNTILNDGWNLTTNGSFVANGIQVSQVGTTRTGNLNLFFANFFTTYSTWYNIAVTTTGVVCRVYKNGVFFGTQNFSSAITTMVGRNVSTYVGNRGALDRTFNGNIASVLVYPNKALSASEILQNYNATKGRFRL